MAPAQPAIPSAILLLPAGSPPTGKTNDLAAKNPFELAITLFATFFLSITGAVVLIRLFTQRFLSKGLAIEDFIIVLAWIVHVASFSESIVSRKYMGQHIWNITVGEAMDILKVLNNISVLYAVIIGLVKIAILLQYLRIFASQKTNKPLRIACWAWIAVNGTYYTVDMFLQIMQCLPREKIWNVFYDGPGRCMSVFAIWTATGIFNTVSDIVILILPLPTIARLQMSKKKRIFVASIFATGSLACVASAIRTYYTWVALESSDTDQTYHVIYVGIWIWIEILIGFLVFCMPVIPAFYFFARIKLRSLCSTLSVRSFSSANLSARTESCSSDGMSGKKPHHNSPRSVPLPFPEVSLASFEQKALARNEDTEICVLKSVSQVVEIVEEDELQE